MPGDLRGEHGRVDDAQAGDAVHAQRGIDDARARVAADASGADGVIQRLRVCAHPCLEVCIADDIRVCVRRPEDVLCVLCMGHEGEHALQCRRARDAQAEAHATDHDAEVVRVREVVGVDAGFGEGGGGCEGHGARRERP